MTALLGWVAETMASAARLAAEAALDLLRLAWRAPAAVKTGRPFTGMGRAGRSLLAGRAARQLAALRVELEQLREAAPAFADIESEARAVGKAWVERDRERARQFERWLQESSLLAFSEERWLALALRWREREAREGMGEAAPELEAWLAAQLLGQIKQGQRRLAQLHRQLQEEEAQPKAERRLRLPGLGREAWRALLGLLMVAALSVFVSSDGAVLPALGWGALNLFAALGVTSVVHEVEQPRPRPPSSPPEPVSRRLVEYLGEGPAAAAHQEEGSDLHSSYSARTRTTPGGGAATASASSSVLAPWLALLLLMGGVAAGLAAGYGRWSQAGSLDPVGLTALVSGVYASAMVVSTLADRLLLRFWALREGVGLAAVASALAATLAVALAELHRYEDARAFRNADMVRIGGPVFRSFVQPTRRIAASWGAATTVDVSSFDVGVRAAGPSRPLGPRRVWLRQTLRRRAVWSAQPGYTYCFSARARSDRYGVSAWGRERCLTVPLDDRSLTRRGRWRLLSGPRFFSGTLTQTDRAGAALSRAVSARRLALVALRCRACGAVDVYLGRKRLTHIELRSRGRAAMQVLPVATWSSPQRGLLKVVALSPKRTVGIDGLAVSLLSPPAP